MKTDIDYVLTLNEEQLWLLQNSVELATRLLFGQLRQLEEFYMSNPRREGGEMVGFGDLEPSLKQIKAQLFPGEPWEGGPSIGNRSKIPDRVREYYDLLQVLSEETKGGVWGGVVPSSKLPLAQIFKTDRLATNHEEADADEE